MRAQLYSQPSHAAPSRNSPVYFSRTKRPPSRGHGNPGISTRLGISISFGSAVHRTSVIVSQAGHLGKQVLLNLADEGIGRSELWPLSSSFPHHSVSARCIKPHWWHAALSLHTDSLCHSGSPTGETHRETVYEVGSRSLRTYLTSLTECAVVRRISERMFTRCVREQRSVRDLLLTLKRCVGETGGRS